MTKQFTQEEAQAMYDCLIQANEVYDDMGLIGKPFTPDMPADDMQLQLVAGLTSATLRLVNQLADEVEQGD